MDNRKVSKLPIEVIRTVIKGINPDNIKLWYKLYCEIFNMHIIGYHNYIISNESEFARGKSYLILPKGIFSLSIYEVTRKQKKKRRRNQYQLLLSTN